MALSRSELARYSRHLPLGEIGVAGQEKLRAARVVVVGAGGLGSPAALYLAACGVGTLGIVDCDRVDVSNLQRQVLFGTADVGRKKAEVAGERLSALNPEISIVLHTVELRATVTVKGVERPVDLPTTVSLLDDGAVRIVAQAELDRHEFGVDGNLLGMVGSTVRISADAIFTPLEQPSP